MEVYFSPEKIIFTSPLPNSFFFDDLSVDAQILEIGCGYGRILKHLSEIGFKNLTGVDCSSVLIERAKIFFPKANYIRSDILELNIDIKYNCILLCGVTEYFTQKNHRVNLINKIFELLDDNGIVIIESFLKDSKYFKAYLKAFLLGEKWGTLFVKKMRLYHATAAQLDTLLKLRFIKIYSKYEKFETWSNRQQNGYIAIYKNRRKCYQCDP